MAVQRRMPHPVPSRLEYQPRVSGAARLAISCKFAKRNRRTPTLDFTRAPVNIDSPRRSVQLDTIEIRGAITKFMRRPNAMADVQKTYAKVIRGRGSLPFRDLQRLLIALGFRLDRISGSHHIHLHPDVSRAINIQPVGKDAKPYQIRQLRDIIREFGLKFED
jgi:predicted RNA binding protein YcfA (HicA-like mRNA interferase family)